MKRSWGNRSTRNAVCLLALVAVVIVVIITAQLGDGPHASQELSSADTPSPLPAGKALASNSKSTASQKSNAKLVAAARRQTDERQRAHHAAISTPVAIEARRKSSKRYRHLDAKHAKKAIVSQQRDFASTTVWQPPMLKAGEEITDYISPTTARIDMPGTKVDAIVESTGGPIATKSGKGALQAIDLELAKNPDGDYIPKNTSQPTSFPKRFNEGIKIGSAAGGGELTIKSGTSIANPSPLGGGKKLFYANTSQDTDAVAEAAPLGAELAWQLRSSLSPTTLPLDASMAVGLTYAVLPDGSGVAKFGDQAVAAFQPPHGFDAQGTAVPTSYSATKSGFEVRVSHRTGKYAYPIVIDPRIDYYGVPAFRDEFAPGRPVTDPATNSPYWSWNAPTPNMSWKTDPAGAQFRMTIMNSAPSAGLGFYHGYLQYAPPNAATIFRAEVSSVYQSGAQFGVVNVGLTDTAGSAWETGWGAALSPGCVERSPGNVTGAGCQANGTWGANGFFDYADVLVCAVPGCSMSGSVANRLRFQEGALVPGGSTSSGTGFASTLGAYVYFSDYAAPTLSGIPSEAWTDPGPSFNPRADDAGVGLGNGANGEGIAMAGSRDDAALPNFGPGPTCGGGVSSPCPTAYIAGAVDTPEGIHNYDFTSADIAGRTTRLRRNLKFDKSFPEIDLSGRLGAFALDTSVVAPTADPRTLAANAPFVITAHDGDAGNDSTARSGVRTISAQLNGSNPADGTENTRDVKQNFDISNPNGDPKVNVADCDQSNGGTKNSCPLKYSGTFNAASLNAGVYYFHVTATDYTGHVTTKIFRVGVGVAEITSVNEGQTTARYVPYGVSRLKGSATQFTLQYRFGNGSAWCNVPAGAVRREADASVVSAWPLSLTGTTSPRLIIDLYQLTGTVASCSAGGTIVDGPVRLRALMDGAGPSFSRSSEDVTVRFDRGGKDTDDSVQKLGPGTVDLVTGNFSMSATDVNIDAYKSDLTVSRTYNSRYADKSSVLGPGWTLGIESESAGAAYKRVVDHADVALPEGERYPTVEIEGTDGTFMTFELDNTQYADGSDKYVSEPGLESLELRRKPDPNDATRTSGFTLKDVDSGTVVTFARPDVNGQPGQWAATDVSQPALTDKIAFKYAYDASGKSIIDTAFSPTGDASTKCGFDSSGQPRQWDSIPRGCQALKFNYDNAGGNVNLPRLMSITLNTFDPAFGSGGAFRTIMVAQYAYDGRGFLTSTTDSRLGLTTNYGYTSLALLSTVTPPGGEQPFTMTYRDSLGQDNSPGRLDKVSRSALSAGTANWNLRYAIPTTGAGAPYEASAGNVAQWGQANPPWQATAIFAPDQTPNGDPATNNASASLSYMDAIGRTVNTVQPGARISVTEYDKYGNVTRSLSAENRARAMNEATPAARLSASQRWDTQNTYVPVPGSPDARQHLVRTVGPEHQIRTDNNTWVQARSITQTCYDEESDLTSGFCVDSSGAPSNEGSAITKNTAEEPLDLPTTTRQSALVGSALVNGRATGGTITDTRMSKVSYGSTAAELQTRTPRLTTTDPDGLDIQRKVILNADGLEKERFQPNAHVPNKPSTTTKTLYYTWGVNPDDGSCSNKPEWVGLPCKIGPGAQPGTAGLPELPVQEFKYNYLRQPLLSKETVRSGTVDKVRTSTKTYDLAGRILTESITSDVGSTVKTTLHDYSATTGRELKTKSLNTDGTTAQTVTRIFDTLGRQTNYTDGAGHASSTTYDLLSRIATTNDGKGTRTNSYDPVTGDLTGVVDSGVGTFLAAYDADGSLIAEQLPGGIVRARQADSTGATTYMSYTRTTGCSSNCLLYDNSAIENAHDQINAIYSNLAGQNPAAQFYTYDAAGRLTQTQDYRTVAGVNKCELRDYAYDADSNRLSKRTRPEPASDCDWGGSGTVKTNTFDAADRITNAGYVYDAFGRTTTVPQADAGGSTNMSASYYANDLAQSITDSGTTQTLNLDPNMRMATKLKTTGANSTTEYFAYSNDTDSPAWTTTNNTALTPYTRNVAGISGDLAAIQDSTSGVKLTLTNLRGDTVAQSTTSGVISNISAVDEFGVPKVALPASVKYGFHGSKRRESLTAAGTVAMGVRLYLPRNGRFLQLDPVLGGTANPYEYPSDPINDADLSGRYGGLEHLTAWDRNAKRQLRKIIVWGFRTVCVAKGWRRVVTGKGNAYYLAVCLAWNTVSYVKYYYWG